MGRLLEPSRATSCSTGIRSALNRIGPFEKSAGAEVKIRPVPYNASRDERPETILLVLKIECDVSILDFERVIWTCEMRTASTLLNNKKVNISVRQNSVRMGRRVLSQNTLRGCAAFTLPEILCAALLIMVAVGSIYLGVGQGYTFTQENTLNIRATQILAEKMETIRLYTWTELTNIGYIPTSFTNYYYPSGDSNGNVGIPFIGTVNIGTPHLTESYSNDIKLVTVTVTWNPGANWSSGSFQHQLQASTFVAHYGMQNYIYGTK